MRTGLTSKTVERIMLDAGAVFRNFDVETPSFDDPIGATRGGATFSVEQELRDIEVDGARGPIKGLKRVITHTASLEVVLMEVSQQLLVDLTRGTAAVSSEDPDLIKVEPSNSVALEDYLDNVALVADIMNQDEPVIILLKNVLVDGEWSIELSDEDEGQISVSFQAHYDLADIVAGELDKVPYEIYFPASIESES